MDELRAGMHVTPTVRLLRPLGQGGMGKVWVAEHTGLRAEVVVKLLSRDVDDKEDALARFSREASVAAQVKSPHVVQVFDYGVTPEGQPYIVMELLEGRDLSDFLAKNGRMTPRDVALLLTQVAKGLGKAHQVGVIHRDIKPENIFLCDGEGGEMFVKLLDFGIAKANQHIVQSTATTTGQVVGTPYYMSPEQIVGEKEIDARTDIWSLGVVAFEALTGKRPFEGATVGAITLALHTAKPRLTAILPDLPPALDAWFGKACARAPSERFATAREAALAFTEAIGGAVADPSGILRAPMDSFQNLDAFAPTLSMESGPRLDEAKERAVTSLSSSFAVPSSRSKKPPMAIVGAAIAAIVLLGALAVFALRKSDAPNANASPPPPVTSATSPATSATTAAVDVPAPDPPSLAEPATTPSATPSATAATTAKTAGASGGTTVKPAGTRPAGAATTRKTIKKSNDDDIK